MPVPCSRGDLDAVLGGDLSHERRRLRAERDPRRSRCRRPRRWRARLDGCGRGSRARRRLRCSGGAPRSTRRRGAARRVPAPRGERPRPSPSRSAPRPSARRPSAPSVTRISASTPADGRRDLGVDLVGRDLEDRLVALHRVADLLQPLRQRPLGDRFAHLGHDDVNTCHALILSIRSLRSPRACRSRQMTTRRHDEQRQDRACRSQHR